MSITIVIAALVLAALIIWAIGAPIARFGGALLVIASLLCIVLGDSIATRAPLVIGGAALWLAGHLLSAYKTRTWSSDLAENIVTHTPLRYLDPVGGHEYRQTRRNAKRENAESGARQAPTPVDDFAEWEWELTADAAPAAPARPVRAGAKHVPARPTRPSRGGVYGKRAAKAAGNLAVRAVPGARAARSAWRFVR